MFSWCRVWHTCECVHGCGVVTDAWFTAGLCAVESAVFVLFCFVYIFLKPGLTVATIGCGVNRGCLVRANVTGSNLLLLLLLPLLLLQRTPTSIITTATPTTTILVTSTRLLLLLLLLLSILLSYCKALLLFCTRHTALILYNAHAMSSYHIDGHGV